MRAGNTARQGGGGGGGGGGVGGGSVGDRLYISLSLLFFLRSLTSRRTPLSERLHEGTTATTKKPEGRKRQ